MISAIKSAWPLFLGLGLIMLGNGLQASLLSLRAALEGFSTPTIGLVMTGYYVGFLAGSLIAPKILHNAGHVRVFAALASMASTSVLVHVVFVEPITWFLMRAVTGFAYAGLYVVAESWLNDMASNKNRGQLLSVYMVVMFVGLAGGQLLLNTADPLSFELFLIVSVLVSVALIPILLTASPAPRFDAPSRMKFTTLYKISPLGVFGCVCTGLAHGAIFGMGAVYAQKRGLSVADLSIFLGLLTVGGIILQWPIGWCSDRFDRRKVLTNVTMLAAIVAIIAGFSGGQSVTMLFVLSLVLGGLTLPMYSLCVAHTNDHLDPKQMVGASSALVFVGGLGACAGPFTAAGVMSIFGASGFFWTVAGAHALVGAFAAYRMLRRAPVPLEAQRHYLNVPAQNTVMISPYADDGGAGSGQPNGRNNT